MITKSDLTDLLISIAKDIIIKELPKYDNNIYSVLRNSSLPNQIYYKLKQMHPLEVSDWQPSFAVDVASNHHEFLIDVGMKVDILTDFIIKRPVEELSCTP